jgi:hypothetical protein
MNIPKWFLALLAALYLPTLGWGVNLQIKVERLETFVMAAQLDKLPNMEELQKMPAMVQETHTLTQVTATEVANMKEDVHEIKDITMEILRNR